jgi:hypothetical protein
MIVYLPGEDVANGTVLFANIYCALGNTGSYSVRLFGLGESVILPEELPEYVYSGLATNDDDSPCEGLEGSLDSDPWNDTYGPAEGPAAIPFDRGSPIHRSLGTAHDVDWIMFTVP